MYNLYPFQMLYHSGFLGSLVSCATITMSNFAILHHPNEIRHAHLRLIPFQPSPRQTVIYCLVNRFAFANMYYKSSHTTPGFCL